MHLLHCRDVWNGKSVDERYRLFLLYHKRRQEDLSKENPLKTKKAPGGKREKKIKVTNEQLAALKELGLI